ncbi:putative monovalent cation/H+ antiporter subunit A [Coralliovum pocilloporae]|uniref:putative monovalent cation/H+ antiporter subunit A n=1 Tax=Coralliovum pocilloporae TaxID=3066369 RepID=UPI0033075F97
MSWLGIDAFYWALAAPFLAAAAAPVLTALLKHRAGWVLALAPAFIVYHLGSYLGVIASGNVAQIGVPWVPSFGVDFSFYIDGLSLLFGLLISGIGTFIIIYAGGYLKGHPNQGRFFSFILMFMGSMLGVVLADNLMTLFIYWELTSITSFLLIGFDHKREASRRAAIQALVVTGGGGLVMLAGFLVLMSATGMGSMSEVISSGDLLRDHPLYVPILFLILGGAFTKSAQFPFHFWLPNAMEAPTPVSAYLHSATMVKAGVYLLMRIQPVFGDTIVWSTVLPLFGGVTLLLGAVLAVRQKDLKLILANTTVASLGLLVMLTGTSVDYVIKGAALYLFAHSLFKGALFMVAGIIDHETGTRDITRLGGQMKAMPITFAAAIVAAWSMAGLPASIGFMAKETMYDGLWHGSNEFAMALLAVAIVGNGLMFAAGFAVAIKPFFGQPTKTPKHAHEAPISLWLGPVVLATLGIVAMFYGGFTSAHLISPTASSIAGKPLDVLVGNEIHINAAFGFSLITIALGMLVFWKLNRIRTTGLFLPFESMGYGPDRGFDMVIKGLVHFSTTVTRILQGGRLEVYMFATFVLTAVVLIWPMIAFDELPLMPEWPELMFYEWAILLIAALGIIAVIVAPNRLTAIVSLGIQGFAVALIFMLFGAPDLSFTQFMVETLSVVILALVMTRLNLSPHDHRHFKEKLVDGGVALACGGAFALLLLKVSQVPFNSSLSEFFAENSRVIAHGRNIVNVIIVDFRGLDTLGEIAVVMITGLAVLALIRVKTRKDKTEEEATS